MQVSQYSQDNIAEHHHLQETMKYSSDDAPRVNNLRCFVLKDPYKHSQHFFFVVSYLRKNNNV